MNEKKFLIVEDEVNVSAEIVNRMQLFKQWKYIGNTASVPASIEQIDIQKPAFIFLDWKLKGGTGYEILDFILLQKDYNPFILFMTAQLEQGKHILEEIVDKYKIVDKYIEKPIWSKLTEKLALFVQLADEKFERNHSNIIWLTDCNGVAHKIKPAEVCCITQTIESRNKEIYFKNVPKPIIMNWTLKDCTDFLTEHQIDFFITNHRKHLVTKNNIHKYDKPMVSVKIFGNQIIELLVVNESLKEFESWLIK